MMANVSYTPEEGAQGGKGERGRWHVNSRHFHVFESLMPSIVLFLAIPN